MVASHIAGVPARAAVLYAASGTILLVAGASSDTLVVSARGKNGTEADTPILVDSAGRLLVDLHDRDGNGLVSGNPADTIAIARSLYTLAQLHGYNPVSTQYERWRNNHAATLLASAARTSAATAALTNYNARGVIIHVNVTARAAATTLTPKLTLKGPVTGTYDVDFWAGAAINSSSGHFTYYFYPGSAPAAGASFTEEVDLAIPRDTQLTVTPNDADSVTYSAGVYYLL